MGLPFVSARSSRGGLFAASTGGGGGGDGTAYYLGTAPNYPVATPTAHFDASDMNGNGDSNSGWSDETCVSLTALPSGTYFDDADAAWKDRTGNYSAGYNTTATEVPKYDDNQAGFPAVFFDGDDDHIILKAAGGAGDPLDITLNVADPSGSDTGWHVFLAFKIQFDAANHNKLIAGTGGSYLATYNTYHLDANMDGSLMRFVIAAGAERGSHDAEKCWVEYRSFDDSGTAKTNCRYHVDGRAVTECDDHGSYPNPSPTVGDLVVSQIGNDGGSISDFLYEIILFGEALSSDDRATVVEYLQDKYSIELP